MTELIKAQDIFDIAVEKNTVEGVDALRKYYERVFVNLPPNTQRAYMTDMKMFSKWCRDNCSIGLKNCHPSNEELIEGYFDSMMESDLALSTVTRRLKTLGVFIEAMNWPNPLRTSPQLKQVIKLKKRKKPKRQKQAFPLQLTSIEKYNSSIDTEEIIAVRDRLILNLMYDGLLRASEVCNVLVSDIDVTKSTLYIPKSKTDQEQEGEYRFVSNTTIGLIKQWKSVYGVEKGYLVRALSKKGHIQEHGIDYMTVYRTYKRIGVKILPREVVSTHSARVGGAVDMAEQNIDIMKIKDSGGWKSLAMPARYTEQARVARSGMSELAELLDR